MEQTVSISRILQEALPYARRFEKTFYELQAQYDEKNAHAKRIDELKNPFPTILKVLYILWGILLVPTLIYGIVAFENGESNLVSVLIPVIFIVVFGFCAINYVKKDRAEEFSYKIKRYNELEQSIPEVEVELNRIIDEAIELGFDFVPLDYFNSSAIQFFISVFDRYLARDMHEAVTLYEQALMRDADMRLQEERHQALMGQLTMMDIHIMMNNNKH